MMRVNAHEGSRGAGVSMEGLQVRMQVCFQKKDRQQEGLGSRSLRVQGVLKSLAHMTHSAWTNSASERNLHGQGWPASAMPTMLSHWLDAAPGECGWLDPEAWQLEAVINQPCSWSLFSREETMWDHTLALPSFLFLIQSLCCERHL